MNISRSRFEQYQCADYLTSVWSVDGLWDEASCLWLLEPLSQIDEIGERGFLQVGRAGVDGIGFGYRLGYEGFWAYYPMEDHFEILSPSITEFVEGWQAGTIAV